MVLFLYWLLTVGNSQTANQTEELRLKYKFTLKRVAISIRSEMLLTILLGNTQIFARLLLTVLAGVFGRLLGKHLNTLRLFIFIT